MITIGGHTIDETLLTDGAIIDVGCRDFSFASHFKGKEVYAIDVDPEVFINPPEGINCMNIGIADKSGDAGFYKNGEGTCLKEIDPDQNHPFIPCKTMTMDELYKITGTNIDVLKLDCEGAEYMILGESFKPIPKQISVEFHYHCVPKMHEQHIDSIMERLTKDYDVHGMVWEPRHGCGDNFWDVLFVRKY